MKKMIILGITIILLIGVVLLISKISTNNENDEGNVDKRDVNNFETDKMQIKSVFKNNEKIPAKYTADGKDANPPLEISGIPSETQSLVLIVDDPDALNGDWVHWVVYGIRVNGSSLKINEDSIPGSQGKNSWGKMEYGGPSPPRGSGNHRYFFKVYALNTEFNFSETPNKKEILNAIEGHILDKAEIVGIYRRG